MPDDLADVYRTTYRALVRFLYRKVWSAERAEDLAQEAFARALVHKPENTRGWVFVVGANRARDEARRAGRGTRRVTLHQRVPPAERDRRTTWPGGGLPPSEARELEGHLAQCRECRVRLDEERALIARADELLGLAAPPDRAIPPFRPGDREPPAQLWWRLRLPLAWAATVVLALGAGLYLGSGVLPRQRAALQNSGDVATAKALTAPPATEPTPSPAAPRQMQRLRSAAAAPTTVAAERKSAVKDQPAEEVASERAAGEVQPSAGPPPTPAPTVTRMVGPYAVTGP